MVLALVVVHFIHFTPLDLQLLLPSKIQENMVVKHPQETECILSSPIFVNALQPYFLLLPKEYRYFVGGQSGAGKDPKH